MLRNILRQLRGNLGAFILAVLLAFVIWIAASLQTDPFADRRYTSVILTAIQQPENTVFLQPIVEQVVVTARAREAVLAELRASSFQAIIDLSGVQPGVPTAVPVVVTCNVEDVRIQKVEPATQMVSLAVVETITRPVTVVVQGSVATGYGIGEVTSVPEVVTIWGPQPKLSEVMSATVTVDVQGVRRPITATVGVELLTRGGNPISGLEWEPRQVQVQVPVRSLAEYKPDVRVVPILRGEPAQGYRRGNVLVKPSVVTLEGPSWILDRLPDFVETLPITITGATESLSRQSLITVPNEVSVVEVSYVTVTVEILPILGTRTMTSTVETIRVATGMRAIPVPNVVTVTLEGPDAKLAALKEEDLLIVLDLRGYPQGVRRIRPDVLVPEGVTLLSVEPESILVLIEPIPTPTPLFSPPPLASPAVTPRP